MTRRTPEVKHAKPERDTGCKSVRSGRRELATEHTSHTVKAIGVDGKRFLFSPDEEKKRREKVPKRVEK